MVFFANFSGISMVGGWIYRNVFLLVIDSTKLSLFVLFVVRGRVQKSAQSEGRKGRKGVSMNNDTDYQLATKEISSKFCDTHLTITTNGKERFDHSS